MTSAKPTSEQPETAARPMMQPRAKGDLLGLLTRPARYVSGPQVLAELRRVIVSGQVAPGAMIPLDEVADFFGVSRIPVREALKTLLGEGLLEHRPRLGYTVTRLSEAELSELYVVAAALEAVALAAAVRSAGAWDHEQLRDVHARLEVAMARAEENRAASTGEVAPVDTADPEAAEAVTNEAGSHDALEFHRLSRDFHEVLLRPCGMPRLLHLLSIARNLTEPDQAMARVDPQRREELCADHADMLAAYVAGDVETLRVVASTHQERIARSITRAWST